MGALASPSLCSHPRLRRRQRPGLVKAQELEPELELVLEQELEQGLALELVQGLVQAQVQVRGLEIWLLQACLHRRQGKHW